MSETLRQWYWSRLRQQSCQPRRYECHCNALWRWELLLWKWHCRRQLLLERQRRLPSQWRSEEGESRSCAVHFTVEFVHGKIHEGSRNVFIVTVSGNGDNCSFACSRYQHIKTIKRRRNRRWCCRWSGSFGAAGRTGMVPSTKEGRTS